MPIVETSFGRFYILTLCYENIVMYNLNMDDNLLSKWQEIATIVTL